MKTNIKINIKDILYYIKYFIIVIILNKSIKIDNKEIKKLIYLYYSFTADSDTNLIFITNVELYECKNKYLCKITTKRPGILIGKAGKDFDDLLNFINGYYKNTSIKIIENKLWRGLYK